jgi:hypothetical protein
MIKENSRVVYTGANRPNLLNKSGKVVAFNTPKTSALVEFTYADGGIYTTDWVGIGALKEVTPDLSDAVKSLESKKAELLTQVAQLDAAITAIKGLA